MLTHQAPFAKRNDGVIGPIIPRNVREVPHVGEFPLAVQITNRRIPLCTVRGLGRVTVSAEMNFIPRLNGEQKGGDGHFGEGRYV